MNRYLLIPLRCLLSVCFVFLALGLTNAQRTVSGTLTDSESGEPLIGTNVVIKGTSVGTITDLDGRFNIQANEGDVLVFSYTGYDSREITVGMSNDYSIQLISGESLEEIVVIGYGSVRKSDLTGSVVAVGEKDFNKGVYTSPEQLIQGQAAGVQVINNSGQPGGLTTVRIRGNASIRTGNEPLYVVDGVQLTGNSTKPGGLTGELGTGAGVNPLSYLNSNDIASMQVLKDASATAIYGSRGANGVIIITTKKGRKGTPSIDFNTSVGFSSILNKYDVLDANEYRAALTEYGLPNGDFGGSVDAFDEILQTGMTNNHSLAVNGGNDDGSYRISLGYLNQEGIIKENELRRLSASLSGGFKFLDNKRLGLDFNLITAHTRDNGPAITTNAGFRGSLIGNALQWNPTHPLYDVDGDPIQVPQFGDFLNPVALLAGYDDVSNNVDVIASIAPSYQLTDNLVYRLAYSITHGAGDRRAQMSKVVNVDGIEGRGIAGIFEENNTNQILTHTLNYITDLSPGINLNAVLGFEYQNLRERGSTFTAQDFILDEFDYTSNLQSSNPNSRVTTSFNNPKSELQSYFLRTNFNVSDKYLVTLTFRADGSSKFGENNKYGFFPAVGAAWNLHTEDFLEGGAFDQLKLRAGWGKTGNSEFPAGAAQDRYSIDYNMGVRLENTANPDLKWETSTTFNIGLDFGFLDQKLSGSIEYFNKNTEDLLFVSSTIQPGPAAIYWINLPGNVINSGVEAALNFRAVNTDNLTWEIGGNIAFLKNVLENYDGPPFFYGQLFGQGSSGATSMFLQNGQPLNAFYTRDFVEINESGQSVYANDGAFSFLGDPNADLILGINTALGIGRLNLNLNFHGAMGHQIYNNTKMSVINIGNLGSRNIDANLLDGDVQEATSNAVSASDRFLENGDFIKLSYASLSYDLGSIGSTFKRTRIYVTGQNLLVFTNYTGFDPEVNTVNVADNGLPSYGIEYIPYPSARTFTIGANFSF